MYECVKLSERCSYMECPTRVGFVRVGEHDVLTVDGGSDKDAGKKILRIAEENGWRITAVLGTHGHADHIGGCHYLQSHTGCAVYLPPAEIAWADAPAINASLLYGGFPGKDLHHKFLLSEPCDALRLAEADLPEGIEPIPLYGHTPRMTGFRVSDGTVFLGDAVCSRAMLEKYPISFLWDIGEHLRTLERLPSLDGNVFLAAHAEPMTDVSELAQFNIDTIYTVGERLTQLAAEPVSTEELIRRAFAAFGIATNAMQVHLVGSTIRSYLTWLCNEGRLTTWFDNATQWFQKQ